MAREAATRSSKPEGAMRSASKSPSRKGRSTSQSRGRSPSRSRSRGRSPGRSTRARSKSPAQRKEKPKKEEKQKEEKPVEKTPATPTQQTRTSRRTTRQVEETKNVNHNETPTRHSARIAAQAEERPRYSEPDRLPETKGRVGKTKEYDFGGPIGALFVIILAPVMALLSLRHCSKKDCAFFKLTPLPKTFASILDGQAALMFLGFVAVQLLLARLPIGRLVEGRNGKRFKYRLNCFISYVITFALYLFAAFYMKYPVTVVYDKFFQLCVVAMFFSFIVSVLLYVKARRAPNAALSPAGNTGNVIYDFFMGHELNPRILGLDLKFFTSPRMGLFICSVYHASLLAKACTTEHAAPNHTLLLSVAMQIIYCIDVLFFEEEWLHSIDITKEGLGYMLTMGYYMVGPVIFTTQSRYVYQQGVQHSDWVLLGIGFLFAAGMLMHRLSQGQKSKFKKNPFNPSLAHLDSIPTSTGRRLLVGGWWGMCRHPNYLAEYIIFTAFSLVCGFTHLFPHLVLMMVVVTLVHRALRDERHMKKTYGSAWSNYCSRVKYRIIPYVW